MMQESLYWEILDNLSEGVYFVDTQRNIRFWNRAAQEITGYTAQEMVGCNCADNNLSHIDEEGRLLCHLNCPLYETMRDGQQRQARVFARHKEGYRIPLKLSILPIRRDGKIVGGVELFTKDSPAVYDNQLIEHLSTVATHDPLTRLPNRRSLEDFLRFRLEEFERVGRRFGVIFADIDDFSRFNNVYGHEAGDIVLKNIASTIDYNVRSTDMVGRWGGEEFVGIYDINTPEEVWRIAQRALHLIRTTNITYKGTLLSVTVSLGVTVAREGDTLASLVDRADRLMYRSKEMGKDRATSEDAF